MEFGSNLINDPADTLSGIPKGVAGLFSTVRTSLTTKADPNEDSKVEQALAVSSNKRELANRLGIDVYSSNKVLQKDLNSVAWATSLGSLTLTAALAPVGGAAVVAVGMTRTAQQMREIVNEYPPQRLRQINQEKLQAMGVPSDLIEKFLDHPSYSPTHDTIIVSSLESLTGAKGRDSFIQVALLANDEETANFFQNIAETMKGFQLKAAPIREIRANGPVVFAKASNGVVLVPFPLDHGVWTQRAGQRVPLRLPVTRLPIPASKNTKSGLPERSANARQMN